MAATETGELRLEAGEFPDLTRWRWVLTDAAGTFLAGHEVRLDMADWQYEAFTDLQGYLSWHVAPDRRAQDEARIVSELGTWIGEQVLGPVAAALVDAAPATVRVVLPDGARWLAFRPLELAQAGGKPLAVQDVTLVLDTGASTGRTAPVGDRLRVLGLFSLPDGGRALNLRRERHELVALIERITAAGKAADVRVLQYGVTRDRLRAILGEAEGWDIIHISGHGAPGQLLLETSAGAPDQVTATDLADLLELARARVKLVTVSACWSASLTVEQQRRFLGLPSPAKDNQPPDAKRLRPSPPLQQDSAPLATGLAARLGCAVLAMRYPVTDEFAIALSEKLYDLLADKGQPLPRAVALTLRHLAKYHPVLSVATPALFGARAVTLQLAAPTRTGPRSYPTGDLKMASFPPPPDRFVGRTAVMARASAALAAESGIPGVLLHGLPGGGKTACALELAHGHEHAFDRLIWYKAPDEGSGTGGVLTDFALTLERYLDGFQMAYELVSAETLTHLLPRLTELLERRLLIVIDNAESLLTDGGHWRDHRWGQVIGALTGHAGPGRVILTSRRVPAGLTGLQVEAVNALSPDEALLLARELPKLQALGRGEIPGINRMDARRLARRAIEAAQGHPKLLELADGQAAHLGRLAALLEASDQAWKKHGGLPHEFFATAATAPGSGPATAADYWHVLAAWTRSVADMLAPDERDLFWFLCCLEESDRQRWILDANWADLWKRLGRDGEPPALDRAFSAVAATGLAAIWPEASATSESCTVHPGVAEAGRNQAGAPFRDAVDAEAAAFWDAVHRHVSGRVGDGSVHTGLMVRAGLAGVPYLLRRQQWDHATILLESAFLRDPSRANAAAVLPAIEQIARHEPHHAGVLAKVLAVADPVAAEARLREYMADAAARDDYRAAAVTAEKLIDLCRESGRLAEALDLARQKADYTSLAGLGPWAQLGDEVQRLQVLTAMGHAEQVLDEVTRLRAHIGRLPATPDPSETSPPWTAYELLLDTGCHAALLLGRWADALALNAEVAASMRARRAPATEIASNQYNDYGPLLALGRTDEALQVLLECRRVFQDARHIRGLGKTLSALAHVESVRGHGEAAVRLELDALRYKYLTGDAGSIAIGYHNLGTHLAIQVGQPALALANHLAAALIRALIKAAGVQRSIDIAGTDLRVGGSAAATPSTVADLCRILGDRPGTCLPALIAALSPDPETAEQVLRDLTAKVQELAAAPTPQRTVE